MIIHYWQFAVFKIGRLVWATACCASVLACASANAQEGPFVYVPNSGSNNATVIDIPTNTVVGGAVATGASPQGVGVRGDQAFIYVANQGDNTVSVINTGTNATVATIFVGNGPVAVAVSPDGQTVYVTNGTDNTVSVINATTNTVVATVAVGAAPQGIAVTQDGALAFVPNFSGNTVSVINTATNTVVATLAAGTGPVGVAITPDGKTAYVTNFSSNNVSVIDVATKTVIATVPVGSAPIGVAVSPDGTVAYVVNVNSATITAISTSTNTVLTNFPVGNLPRGVVFSPDGRYAYVSNFGGNNVSVVDTTTRLTIATLSAGTTPSAFPGVCSNGNALLAAGRTFIARTSGSIGCTLASGATGATGPIFTGGTLQIAAAGISTSLPITLMTQGGTIDTNGNTATLSGSISGPGGLTKVGAGTLILSGSSNYLGATLVNTGTLQAGGANVFSASSAFTIATGAVLDLNSFDQAIGSLSGNGHVTLGTATLTAGSDNTSTTFSGVISGSGGLTKTGNGALTLTGANAYTGSTNVNGGVLDVEGSIATLGLTTVNNGGLLMGTGSVGPVLVANGGKFEPGSGSPGSSMTVAGNLTFQSGAQYIVQLNPTTASFASVTGAATLNGATSAVFANGNYVAKSYTILSAVGGVNGTFSSLIDTNLSPNFNAALTYDATHAFLDLSLKFVPPPGSGLNINQQNVADAIVGFFNRNNGISLVYGGLTANGLTQASGEVATASQQTSFDAMNLFLGLLSDPFMGRGNGINGSSSSMSSFAADENQARAYAARRGTDAFAMLTKAPTAPFLQRWSVWAAGFGGSQTTNGDSVVGSNDMRSNIFGTAVGADYLFSPDTLAGFALAGGGTNFNINGLGTGRSDLFQAGAYMRHTDGPAYVTGVLAYGWQDVTTDRTLTVAGIDHLRAEFKANAYSGRLEGGYRFVAPLIGGVGVTPYAAGQFTTFDLPAYAESVVSGTANFALAYSSKSVTDSRTEFGFRADKSFLVQAGLLTLRGRLAWAHDFNRDRSIVGTFQALPGASFVVSGAAQAPDSALTTASAEMKWSNGWSAAATFEGAFSDATRSYAGKGIVRYTW